ncbi:MAG: peptidylprolyl isomerase [Candidatus Woesearchaeota archaeon]
MTDEHLKEENTEHSEHKHLHHETKQHHETKHTGIGSHGSEKKEKSNLLTIALSVLAILVILFFIMNINKFIPMPEEKTNILAKVNGKDITIDELNAEIAKLPPYYSQVMDPISLKKNVLEQVIVKKLLIQEAAKLKLEVTDKEIKQKTAEVYQQFNLTEEKFLEKLKEQNIKYEDFINDYREQMLLNKVIETVLVKNEPTEEAIKEYYDNNKDTLISVKASHILVCFKGSSSCTKERSEDEALKIIDEITKKINDGDDFAELAKEYSDGPSSSSGGALGWFTKGKMVPEFEKVSFELEAGEVSKEPVKTEFGYHIIKAEEKKTAIDELKGDIISVLKEEELQSKMGTYLDSLKKSAKIEYVTPVEMTESPASEKTAEPSMITTEETKKGITSFMKKDNEICRNDDGKPLVFLFSTTWCPHCKWIKETFDNVAKEYIASGQIEAYHWEIDTNDNTLTEAVETSVPEEHIAFYKEFNPEGTIPTFVFGCTYYRTGNAPNRETKDDKQGEAAEFKAVIDELLKNSDVKNINSNDEGNTDLDSIENETNTVSDKDNKDLDDVKSDGDNDLKIEIVEDTDTTSDKA